MSAPPIPHAVLMCHAPIVLPAIGKSRAHQCRVSTAGMRQAAKHLMSKSPDVIVLLSPHTPRLPNSFGLMGGDVLKGDFSSFGAPDIHLAFPNDVTARAAILDAATNFEMPIGFLSPQALDHGAAVPLAFLQEIGFIPPVVLISFPAHVNHDDCRKLGDIIRHAAHQDQRRWAILASGDMSHRLMPGAPAGFDPEAKNFDAAFTECVKEGRYEDAVTLNEELRHRAAEDVVDSVEIAAAACAFETTGHRFISYEGPFGVGYLVAVLHDAYPTPEGDAVQNTTMPFTNLTTAPLFKIARDAICAHLRSEKYEVPQIPGAWPAHHGLFVTLWTADGKLRGCIDHTQKAQQPLAEEVAQYAVLASTRDPRFDTLSLEELDDLRLELSILTPSEAIEDRSTLDPKTYGVIVKAGNKRGVLLPNVAGVDTVDYQIEIACQKAGISPHEQLELFRFKSIKLKEGQEA